MPTTKFRFIALLFLGLFVFTSVVSAKDQWLQVRSKNFFLIGNASEKDIRKVATRLEQFRESFRLIFGESGLKASIPTNVVVFKSESAYKPFKPKRGDGKIDNFVAGYFQPGEDVNYITLSTQGTESSTYGLIFHEYVHFILNTSFGKSEVPPWFNEGLAEYYQTFEIADDQEIMLGKHQDGHVLRLRENKLIPLGDFFETSNQALSGHGDHSRSIFYSQAWALIHYLTFNGKGPALKKFLSLRMANKPAEEAFREAFGFGYAQMEKELRNYVGQGSFKYMVFPLKTKLVFDTEMSTSPLTEAESNAYLGDLLYHVNRVDDAEPYLKNAIAAAPDLGLANTTLGMVKIRQRKYDEAKQYLEKAISQDQKNHLALYRYAYLLSREGRDEFGFVNRFEDAAAAKMRDLLKKAIAINPTFAESYELLAFINLVNNEQLDDAVASLQTAMKYQPGNSRYAMRIAEIYLRQDKYKEAGAIAEKIAATSDDAELRSRAASLVSDIKQREAIMSQYDNARRKSSKENYGVSGERIGEPVLVRRRPGEEKPTAEEIASAREKATIAGINQSLRVPPAGESRVLGHITKIDCSKGTVLYSVKTESETFALTSKDFQSLEIMTYVTSSEGEVGCDSKIAGELIVISFRPDKAAKPPVRGELVAVEFVPKNFRFMDPDVSPKPPTYVVEEAGAPPTDSAIAEQRRKFMLQSIRESLRTPGPGERRELGFIERSECTSKGMFFDLKVGDRILRLVSKSPQSIMIRGFTAEVENLPVGCGMKQLELPVVMTFRDTPDTKTNTAGELLSLEFVPKSFTLN